MSCVFFQHYGGANKVLELSYPFDVEGSQVSIIEEEAVFEFVLAAKFLTKKALNVEAIAKTFTPIWRLKNGFRVTKESDHALLFTFDT